MLSQLGTRLSGLAVPLLAILTLKASTLEVSLLRSAETLAWLLFGLVAGGWVDRLRQRPVLIAADAGRAVILASIPIAAIWHGERLWQFYAALFLVGLLTVFFDIAHTTYLPQILGPDELMDGNSKLAANTSIAAIAGGSFGGFLVQWLTAPFAIAVDAASYLWSALWLRTIQTHEEPPLPEPDRHLRREIREGLAFVLGNPLLRPIALNTAGRMLFQSAYDGIILVYLVRRVHLTPGIIGLLSTVGFLGALAASYCTTRITARIGDIRALVIGSVVNGLGFVSFALTGPEWRLGFFVLGGTLTSFTIVLMHIVSVTTVQTVCPESLLGRVNATMQVMIWGVMPIGSIIGGLLATFYGLHFTLWFVGTGMLLASLWLVVPARNLRLLPQ